MTHKPKATVALIFACLFCVMSPSVFAQNVFLPDTPEVEELRELYARARLAFPETSFPVSRRDLHRRALELGTFPRTGNLAAEIDEYLQRLGYNDRDIVVTNDVDLRLQLFTYKTAIDNYPRGEFFERERDVDPFLALRLGFHHDAVASIYIRGDVIAEYNRSGYTNLPPSTASRPVAAEYNFVTEGYIQYFFGPMETVFGRQRIHIGPAPDTSLMVSRQIPFVDALRVKLPLGPLTMTALWATLENRQTLEEALAAVPDGSLGPIRGGNGDDFYNWQRNTILLSIARFEWHYGRTRAGIGGRTIIARDMNEFHLGDFFPVFSRHNGNIVPNNLSVVGDVTFLVMPGLETYVIFGLDDMDAGKIGYGDDDIPTIGAYVAGTIYRTRVGEHRLTATAEVGVTHDLWGNFDIGKEDHRLSRAIYRMDTQGPNRAMPLTSPYGPGVIWAQTGARLATDGGLTAQMDLLFLNRNTGVDVYSTPYDGQARDGDHASSFQVSLDFRQRIGQSSYLSLAPRVLFDSDGADWRMALGGGTSFGRRRTVGQLEP
ncbi:MAG: hypothetical protein EA403_07200 [Spirochaetaceae bacterium]|nr:MAG: hypothetical protein EA403_07200 [Spirochaetaceae bacterium]